MPSLKVALRDLVHIKRQAHELDPHNLEDSQPSPVMECRPILVNTASPDEKGCLVLADGRLVAVLVHVVSTDDKRDRKELSGWQMEAGFGRCAVPVQPLFDTLADATAWMRVQLSAR